MDPLWLVVAFWFVLGLAYAIVPKRTARFLFGPKQSTTNPFDTRWSPVWNRITGFGFVVMSVLVAYVLLIRG
jgi:hypothetical protein